MPLRRMHCKLNFIYDAKRRVPDIKGKIKFRQEDIFFLSEYALTQFSLWHTLIRILKFSVYHLHRIYLGSSHIK